MNEETIAHRLDTSGTCCPMPMVNTNKAIKAVGPGELVEVIATDPATQQDIPDWCQRTGHRLVDSSTVGGTYRYLIRRASQ